MKKIKFKNKVFQYSLIGYLILILFSNIDSFEAGNITGIILGVIQLVVLFFILSKNKYAKSGIKIWAIIIILSNGISLAAKSIKIFLGDQIVISELINKIIFFTIGILIYIFNEKYVEIIKFRETTLID